ARPPPSSLLSPYTTLFRSLGLFLRGIRAGRVAVLLDAIEVVEPLLRLLRELRQAALLLHLPVLDGSPIEVVGAGLVRVADPVLRSEEHTSELQSLTNLVCR